MTPCLQKMIKLFANQVERDTEAAFVRAARDPAIHKRVQVIKGPLKGSAGYVVDKNHVMNVFVVGLESSGVKANFQGEQLVYL